MPPSPAVTSAAPAQSSRRGASGSRLSGSRQKTSPSTTTARGGFTKKAQRHERCSISQPPRTGPKAVVIALKPDHVPMARPRSCSGNDALMMARLPGTRSAAPTPCTARAVTSCPTLAARPQAVDAAAKRAIPLA